MSDTSTNHLSRRERQIMDIIYQRGPASVADVQAGLADPPSYSSVRALLGILVDKGHLKIQEEGPRYLYLPTREQQQVGRSAIKQVMETFFGGSIENAVAALLDVKSSNLSKQEVERLKKLIDQARKEAK